MDVYIEITYLINACIILLTFEILCFLLNIQFKLKQLAFYCLTYNISFIFLYIDFFDGFLLFYYLLLTYLYFKKKVVFIYPIFLFIYISIISFSHFVVDHTMIYQNILLIEDLNISILLLFVVLSIIIIYFYISYIHYISNYNQIVQVYYQGECLYGLIDNGNQVFYKGSPVLFIAERYCNEQEILDTIDIFTAYRNEKVPIIQIKEICINYTTYHNIYGALMPLKDYDVILNSNIMGGFI